MFLCYLTLLDFKIGNLIRETEHTLAADLSSTIPSLRDTSLKSALPTVHGWAAAESPVVLLNNLEIQS